MNALSNLKSAWKSAQLLVAFHQSRSGRQREKPRLWTPKNGVVGVTDDTAAKESYVVVRGSGNARDVVIKLQPDKITLHREASALGWADIRADHHSVSVLVGDVWITVQADGSIKREIEGQAYDASWLEADGSFIRVSPELQIVVSSDGSELSRRTDTRFDGITADGVVSRRKPPTGDVS